MILCCLMDAALFGPDHIQYIGYYYWVIINDEHNSSNSFHNECFSKSYTQSRQVKKTSVILVLDLQNVLIMTV